MGTLEISGQRSFIDRGMCYREMEEALNHE